MSKPCRDAVGSQAGSSRIFVGQVPGRFLGEDMRNRVVVLARSLGHDGNLRSWVSHDYASSCGKLGSFRLTVSEAQALYDVATRDKRFTTWPPETNTERATRRSEGREQWGSLTKS